MSCLTFDLKPLPPFRLDLTVWVLRRLPINAIDRWDGSTYRRVLTIGERAVDVRVTQISPPTTPRLRISYNGSRIGAGLKPVVTRYLDKL